MNKDGKVLKIMALADAMNTLIQEISPDQNMEDDFSSLQGESINFLGYNPKEKYVTYSGYKVGSLMTEKEMAAVADNIEIFDTLSEAMIGSGNEETDVYCWHQDKLVFQP